MSRRQRSRCTQRICAIIFSLMILMMAVHNFIIIASIVDISMLPPIMFDLSNNDILKYKTTNFSLCDIGYKSIIYLGSHHKECNVNIILYYFQETHNISLSDWYYAAKLSIIYKNHWIVFERALCFRFKNEDIPPTLSSGCCSD